MLSRPQLDSGSAIPLLPSGRGARLNPMLTRLAGWGYARAPLLPRSFRQVAAAHGAENLRTVADLLGADVALFTVMEDELSGTELPASMHRVGPIFARLPGEIPEVVRKLAAASRPVVYLAFGSSGIAPCGAGCMSCPR